MGDKPIGAKNVFSAPLVMPSAGTAEHLLGNPWIHKISQSKSLYLFFQILKSFNWRRTQHFRILVIAP